MELDQVKYTIKQWERSFLKKNGRPPSKKDVRSDPTVRLLYQTYNELKHGGTPRKAQAAVLLPDEIGPTPQANGRVLSIFDHHLTPPASSPSNPFGSQSMTTPTKLAPPSTTEAVSGSGSLMDKLLAAASPQKSSPIKHSAFSPVKHLRTPTKPTVAFSATPSPLKPQRLVGRLTKVFVEATSASIPEIDDEDLLAAPEVDPTDEPDAETTTDDHQPTRKKVKTQKRTTRNWKIKARGMDEAPDMLAGKNLQDELKKLASQAQAAETTAASPTAKRTLESVREVRDSDNDESSEEEEAHEPVVYKRPHVENGIAPMSFNFQRARINDPRIAKFKRRVRR